MLMLYNPINWALHPEFFRTLFVASNCSRHGTNDRPSAQKTGTLTTWLDNNTEYGYNTNELLSVATLPGKPEIL